ncbi:polysaccharide biosynthesis/export family protein [Sphingobacterium sp. BIGb0165]|uniref:polysaccharide biosynthesis/export family protein n=1 Tax=Sphingobacterium sp. BIGb0165 TaxID=2940615 RepID=UPI0021696904|nr:polysaccharide biosynthesis/export family protein [Sphingobacterium sp. BIGb0165]MCS4226500.1 polysaccharide export outer membrane protein [Sphingobacterium sp. BIGb0165]
MKKLTLWIVLLGLALFSSCAAPKKIVYVNDMVPNIDYRMLDVPMLKLQKSDRLSIKISAKNPELAAPFNVIGGSYSLGEKENGVSSNAAGQESQSYLIDQQGNITFPILGNFHLEGLTLEQVRDLLSKRLSDGGFIKDAIVKVELLNLKVNVMGEVNRVGIIDVPDARLNLLEAISKAGGLTRNAASDRVTVIREENGVRKKLINNIGSQDIFDSPAYYLQQNDIVYVEPIAAESTAKEDRTWRFAAIATGVVTVLLTALNLLK